MKQVNRPEKKIYYIEGTFLDKYRILLFSDRCENMDGEFTLFKDDKVVFHKSGYLKGFCGFYDFIEYHLDIYINSDQTIYDEIIGTKIPLTPAKYSNQYRYEEEEKDV